MSVPKYVLDSCVLIDFVQKEHQYKRIKELLTHADVGKVELFMSMINFCEGLYFLTRIGTKHSFSWWENHLNALPLTIAMPSERDYLRAAYLKSQGGISFPDCFAITLGESEKATVVTRDQEFAKFGHLIQLELHE
jgi:predicted nucleic acid-binding protein